MDGNGSRVVVVLLAATSAMWSCSGGDEGGDGGAGADSGPDAGADTDTDTGSVVVVDDYWDWESAPIPEELAGAWVDSPPTYRLHATAADDVTVCSANYSGGWGGLASFDGSGFTIEGPEFECEAVWGLDADHVWAFGVVDITIAGEPLLYCRSGGVWSQDTVEGLDDSCRFESIYGASADDVTLVGTCGGVRQSWVPAGAGAWAPGDAIVPTDDQLDMLRGALALPEGDVFYGSGLFESAGGTDLGYPAAPADWVDGDAMSDLFALTGDELLSLVDGSWTEFAACPYDLPEDYDYCTCWGVGARDGATGDIYLGGGGGSECPDDWRLNRIGAVDGEISSVLAPSGTASTSRGVHDMSVSPDGVLFAIATDTEPRLMWHALPTGD